MIVAVPKEQSKNETRVGVATLVQLKNLSRTAQRFLLNLERAKLHLFLTKNMKKPVVQ